MTTPTNSHKAWTNEGGHVKEFQGPAIHCLIELEVDRPDVVWIVGPQQLPGAVCWAAALAPARKGPLEPLLSPDPLHPLVIDAPVLKPQPAVDQPPPPPHMAAGQFTDAPAKLLLLNVHHRLGPALGVAVLAGQAASTALGNPESILQNHHGSAAAFRAQKFPSASSLSIALSSSASASRRLRRLFSCSSSLRRLASVAFMPP